MLPIGRLAILRPNPLEQYAKKFLSTLTLLLGVLGVEG
jgi:hypothetical protein